jgi:geranylgeranyl pyrophosphate synthase
MYDRFQDYAENLRPALDDAITGHLGQLLGDTRLHHPVEETQFLTGGKKVRGSLLCLVAAALGGTLADALPRAVAVELIQAASLIHDDFVDQHRIRRGLPALWTLAGARRAVLLGDVIFSSAIYLMSELGREDCQVVSRAIAEVSRGAYQEPLDPSALLEDIAAGRLDAALYEKINYLKTGVLFGAACELGALAATADEGRQQAWRRYGLQIGEAYQIADDLQEIDHHLDTRTITARELTALAPALLSFATESRPYLCEALGRESVELRGGLAELFQAAAAAMHAEKERHLRAAVSEIAGDLPDSGLCRLVQQAPWDLLSMFATGSPQSSWPSQWPTPRR